MNGAAPILLGIVIAGLFGLFLLGREIWRLYRPRRYNHRPTMPTPPERPFLVDDRPLRGRSAAHIRVETRDGRCGVCHEEIWVCSGKRV